MYADNYLQDPEAFDDEGELDVNELLEDEGEEEGVPEGFDLLGLDEEE